MSGDVNGRDNNGVYTKLSEIHGEVSGLEERLGEKIAQSVDNLSLTIYEFKKSIDRFYSKSSRKIDVDIVAMMFGVVVLAVVGIKGSEWFFNNYLVNK